MIHLPEKCLRGYKTCLPLAQVVSDDGESFNCVGNNDGSRREIKQDRFTLCYKNTLTDQEDHVDERDLIDQASVICQGLSAIFNDKINDKSILWK